MQNLPPNPSEQLSRLEQQALDTALHDFLREIFVSQGEPAYERAMEDFIRLNSEIGRYPAIKKLTEVPIPTSQPDGVVSPDAPLSVE